MIPDGVGDLPDLHALPSTQPSIQAIEDSPVHETVVREGHQISCGEENTPLREASNCQLQDNPTSVDVEANSSSLKAMMRSCYTCKKR
jgi:hypothetical protein